MNSRFGFVAANGVEAGAAIMISLKRAR